MTSETPDIRAYLEIRTAAPSGWSPDARSLLVSSDLPGSAQVHRLDVDGTALPVEAASLIPITRFEEPIGAGYLPADPTGRDEHRLLLATDRGGNERHQLFTASHAPTVPFWGPDELEPLVVDDEYIHRPGGVTRDGRLLAYATNRGDGVAFDTWVRDLVDGGERRVFATGGWTGPGGFSPDGRYLAVSEMTTRPGDNVVHLVDLRQAQDGALGAGADGVVELAPHPERESSVGTPSWLPDSSAFFFTTDVGRDHGAIARGTPDGHYEVVVEKGWDAGCGVDWSGRHLLVVWNDDGRTRAELRDPYTLEVTDEVALPGDGVAGGFRFTRDGRWLAFSFSSATVPGDVWRYDTQERRLERVTVSPCAVDPASFVAPELVRFPSFDGLEVPAFVYRPRRAAERGPAPVVVVVHGGPESQYRPSFTPLTQYLVAQGFAVVAPNVRGSTGYGRRYQHLDDVEKRLDSVRDLAALHDWLGTQPDLDADRAALYGGSYGGYMTLMGLVLQPERWAAGVDIVGMSNLVTFLENTSAWRRAFREREYGSLEHHRDVLLEASPITYVDELRAPLFIVHGANDPRVPLSEAEQLHAVLRERGVRSELLVYADEGHGLSKLANRIDCYPQVAAFLHDVLGD
ncbi:alpha/beta fold hydrolase [Egicoccus sp. AB-alg2]|uniref:S9 family peptidase n=1 Tax=Egicoccus sp. AB-alg2 TaxID=3242693 RepID=UPI00359EEF62